MAEPWWQTLYRRQHEVWPGWSEGEGDAAAVAELLEELVGKPGHALDLGCGVGRELCALGKRGWTGLGIDLSEALIERARARAARLGVDVRFEQGDLLAEPGQVHRPDLIVVWDSVLAIWDAAEQARILGRWARVGGPGTVVAVGQLSRELAEEKGSWTQTFESPAVGPGRTERTYRWEGQVLFDEVVWHPPDGGEPEALPTQQLRLLSRDDLAQMLRGAGLADVQVSDAGLWQVVAWGDCT